jgi:dihydrofolate reductase
MRKIVAGQFITLDGVVEIPEEWMGPYFTPELGQQPGQNIGITGSGTLVSSLLREGLLDELHLFVFPLVAGSGKRLFGASDARLPLRLLDSATFQSGVLHSTYAKA